MIEQSEIPPPAAPLYPPQAATSSPQAGADPRPSGQLGGRFYFIDALRGIAALWVVIFHAYSGKHLEMVAGRLPGWAIAFFESGHFGVPIFFVLSGFVIAHSVSRHKVDLPFIGRFALRRSLRLDPPYWASMALVIGLGVLAKIAMPARPYQPPSPGQIAAHVFYVQEILRVGEINPIYWTLAIEIQFYLIFCALMGLAHATRRGPDDRRSLLAIFLPATLLAAAWPLGLIQVNLWPGLFLPLWHGFLLGALACWAMHGTIGAAWFYGYAALVGAGAAYTSNDFTAACVATSALIMIAVQAGGLKTWLNWRWLQFLGLISYSLYLIHNPISGALYNVGYRITGRSIPAELFWFAAMLAANVLAAAAFWWLFERPSLTLAQKIRPSRPKADIA